MKYAGPDFNCGEGDVCGLRPTPVAPDGDRPCVVSFDTPMSTSQTKTARKEELWLTGIDSTGAVTYTNVGVTSSAYVNSEPPAEIINGLVRTLANPWMESL